MVKVTRWVLSESAENNVPSYESSLFVVMAMFERVSGGLLVGGVQRELRGVQWRGWVVGTESQLEESRRMALLSACSQDGTSLLWQ
jgi:hypothetical protein